MSDSASLKQVIQTLNTGVAIADAGDWSIVFENAKFFEWFPATK